MKKMYLLPLLGLLLMFGCQDQMEEISIQDEAMKPNKLKAEEMNSNGRMVLTSDLPINDDCWSGSTDLVAGQHNVVGKVMVTKDGDDLKIDVYTNPGCGIGLVHIAIAPTEDEIPQTKSGKAIPGQFSHHESFSPYTGHAMASFDISSFTNEVVIAVHAEVYCGEESEEVCEVKNIEVTTLERIFDPSYFNFKINDEIVNGWCINFDETMELKTHNVKYVPSTCADPELLACLFGENAENIGAVNWLINQKLDGYEPEDIQMTIWTLMRNNPALASQTYYPIPQKTFITIARGADKEYGGINDTNSDFYPLYERALENKDFVPSCGDKTAIILYKDCNTDLAGWQTSLITKTFECGTVSETAWASGRRFVTQGDWGMYTTFDLCD